MMSDGSGSGHGHAAAETSTKRVNPLVELMNSEKVYVEHLGLVIRVRENRRESARGGSKRLISSSQQTTARSSSMVSYQLSTYSAG